MRRLRTVVLAAVLAPAASGAGAVPAETAAHAGQAGQAAYDSGRFGDALRIWQPLAAHGDAQAAFGLGLMYDLGQGVPPDAAAAYRWYRRAAEAGVVAAEFNVGVMCDSGVGMARDPQQAAGWYARAAAHGHARAAYNLAQLYAAGDGVPRNPQEAAAWYAVAASGGVSAARDRLDALRKSPAAAPAEAAAHGPVPVIPFTPPDAAPLPDAGTVTVELAWAVPPQSVPVKYFVQVFAIEDGATKPAFSGYAERSAMLVKLPGAPGHYVWRVYAIAATPPDYAASDWSRFAVK